MPVRADDVIRVTVTGQWTQGDIAQHVFHFINEGVLNVPDITVMESLDIFLEALYSTVEVYTSQSFTWGTFKVYNMTLDAPTGEQAFTTPVTGLGVEQALTFQLAPLISFPTGRKKTVGKKYMAAFTIACQDGANKVALTARDDMDDFGTALLAAFTAASQPFTPGAYRELTLIFTPFASYLSRQEIYTQRRRRAGEGE